MPFFSSSHSPTPSSALLIPQPWLVSPIPPGTHTVVPSLALTPKPASPSFAQLRSGDFSECNLHGEESDSRNQPRAAGAGPLCCWFHSCQRVNPSLGGKAPLISCELHTSAPGCHEPILGSFGFVSFPGGRRRSVGMLWPGQGMPQCQLVQTSPLEVLHHPQSEPVGFWQRSLWWSFISLILSTEAVKSLIKTPTPYKQECCWAEGNNWAHTEGLCWMDLIQCLCLKAERMLYWMGTGKLEQFRGLLTCHPTSASLKETALGTNNSFFQEKGRKKKKRERKPRRLVLFHSGRSLVAPEGGGSSLTPSLLSMEQGRPAQGWMGEGNWGGWWASSFWCGKISSCELPVLVGEGHCSSTA